ncbi:hypothetical protein K239x_26210 [Planctomycetes bacterium K23_9]|uniref:Uncharacterized protein n=1 Tax=Stieleria marina TaxID=1930275 RepID=A0A517NU63_9BACT|nr:hypothetical protein K239x_26210 [Planctomycetes bacterium K23_9]
MALNLAGDLVEGVFGSRGMFYLLMCLVFEIGAAETHRSASGDFFTSRMMVRLRSDDLV